MGCPASASPPRASRRRPTSGRGGTANLRARPNGSPGRGPTSGPGAVSPICFARNNFADAHPQSVAGRGGLRWVRCGETVGGPGSAGPWTGGPKDWRQCPNEPPRRTQGPNPAGFGPPTALDTGRRITALFRAKQFRGRSRATGESRRPAPRLQTARLAYPGNSPDCAPSHRMVNRPAENAASSATPPETASSFRGLRVLCPR